MARQLDHTRHINIFSGERGLGGALTLSTEVSRKKGSVKLPYAVKFAGVVFEDAAAAYQAHRSGNPAVDDSVMAYVIAERFRQHPLLALEVERRGGGEWLATCSHLANAQPEDDAHIWEGAGLESRFIRNLVEGWRRYQRGIFHQPRQGVIALEF